MKIVKGLSGPGQNNRPTHQVLAHHAQGHSRNPRSPRATRQPFHDSSRSRPDTPKDPRSAPLARGAQWLLDSEFLAPSGVRRRRPHPSPAHRFRPRNLARHIVPDASRSLAVDFHQIPQTLTVRLSSTQPILISNFNFGGESLPRDCHFRLGRSLLRGRLPRNTPPRVRVRTGFP